MSYLVFARKWRPLSFDDVVGQEHVTGTLKKAIEKNRIAHAYIFSGTRGVGKTTTARILARALNCEKGPTPNPCGVCESCKGVVSGSSFDVLEIDGASNNSVDDIRQLRENVGYTSMGGNYRIFVIDEVHMLSKAAFNALLKTLEEPPPAVIFIFATTEPQKIPATIHSRCQRYDFRRIVPEQILQRLEKICVEEKISYEKSALMLIARKADGSMRDALSMLDQACSYCPENLSEKEVRLVLGLVGMEVYAKIMDAVAAKTPAPALEAVQEVLYQGFDLHEFVVGLEEYLRTLLFSRIPRALESAGIVVEGAIAGQLRASSERFSEGDLLRMMELVRRSENEIKWSALPRLAIENMLLKLVYLDSTVSIERLLSAIGSQPPEMPLQQSVTSAPAAPDVKKNSDLAITPPSVAPTLIPERRDGSATVPLPPSSAAHTIEEPADRAYDSRLCEKPDVAERFEDCTPGTNAGVQSRWPAFVESFMHDRPNIGTFLSLATVSGATESSIDLTYAAHFKFQFAEMTKKQNREEINRLLQAFMGRPIDVHITLETKKAEKEAQNYIKSVPHAHAIESEIEREPIIQSVLDIFDGEILK
jgi:DNA polymerase III subunit gamma/tau